MNEYYKEKDLIITAKKILNEYKNYNSSLYDEFFDQHINFYYENFDSLSKRYKIRFVFDVAKKIINEIKKKKHKYIISIIFHIFKVIEEEDVEFFDKLDIYFDDLTPPLIGLYSSEEFKSFNMSGYSVEKRIKRGDKVIICYRWKHTLRVVIFLK